MANAMYDTAKTAWAAGDIDWDADDFKLVCVDSADYTLDLANHDFLDDIPAGGRVATSSNLASKTNVDGVLDCADVTLSSVTGDEFEYVILYRDSGVASTSQLIACWDTATGLALTPGGGDVTITINASGLMALFT